MFRESATARYVLRGVVTMMLAGLASLSTALVDDSIANIEWVAIGTATVGALAAYLGIGAATPQVEPFVGNTMSGVEVPVPPATAED